MKDKLLLSLMGVLILITSCLHAQESPAKKSWVDKPFDLADGIVDLISRGSWTFIPAVTYAPETSLGLGARAIKVFRPKHVTDSITRPSTFPLTFLYTLNQQAFVTAELNLWEIENQGYLNARLELTDFPFRFYGIGNEVQTDETYATRFIYFHLNYEKRLLPGLYVGPRYEFRTDDIYQKQEGGLLASGLIPGSEGQRLSGLGVVVNYDTRDNIFQPSQGVFHQFSYTSFGSTLGSNFTFSEWRLDVRKYYSPWSNHVIVGQAWANFTTGNPPFQHVSLIGGSDLMRGYFEGRYRDRHAMVYQLEYRLPVYRKFGMVFFGSAGQVTNDPASFSVGRFRYGGGLGFRYRLNEEGLNFRFDIAIGDQRAFYFGLNEVI
jgi:hypothetical protein